MTREQAFAEGFWRHAGRVGRSEAQRITRYRLEVASVGLWGLLRLTGRGRRG